MARERIYGLEGFRDRAVTGIKLFNMIVEQLEPDVRIQLFEALIEEHLAVGQSTDAVVQIQQDPRQVENALEFTEAFLVARQASLPSGLAVKQPARVGTTADIGATYAPTGGLTQRGYFTSAPTTVDGILLEDNDRILVKDQINADENGIYYAVDAAAGEWDRATDFDQDEDARPNSYLWCEEGATWEDTSWVLTTDRPIVVGGLSGTDQTWIQFGGAGALVAGDGISIFGTVISVQLDGDSAQVSPAGLKTAVPVLTDKARACLTTTTDGQPAFSGGITSTPAGNSYPAVFVNGIQYRVALDDSERTTAPCYFSGDGGATARAIADIVAGDRLYWNGSQVMPPFQLAPTDTIILAYVDHV